MPEISKIKLPSGSIYDIKDEVARQAMTGGMHFRGVSTTSVTDGGDENPTIDGQKYYSKRTGDVVVYDSKEFVYSCNDTPLSSPYLHLTTYDYTVQSYHIVSTYDRSTQVLTCTDDSAGLVISFDVTYTANSVTFTYKSNIGWSSANSKKFNWTQSGTAGSMDLTLSTSFTKTFSNTDTAPVTGISLSGTNVQIHRLATDVYTDYYEGHWTEFGDLSDLGDLAYIDKDGDATKYLNGTGAWTVPPKNTAGSTDTSSKIFLIGATSQAASPQTYSHDTAYVGTDGCLYSGGTKVLTAHQTIKQDGVTGATVNRYASCSTAADTAAKTASITTGTFSLEAGSIVNVKFANTNSASTPTLNINSTGAKNIFSNGAQITTGTNKGLLKGLCTFIYDGTQYHLVGGYIDTQYSLPTATYNVLGGVKPWYSHTAASTGPTAGTNATAVAVNTITTTAGKYYAVESDSNGRLFVNVPWSDRTYTAFTGKPTTNQTPAFGGTATISQISQATSGQVSGTDRTIKIPDTIATYDAVGLVKPFSSWTGTASGPTPATSTGGVTVQNIMNGPLDYHAVEIDSTGRLFVNVPVDQVFNVTSVTSKNALNSGIQGAIYDNGRVSKGSGTTAVVIYGTVDITTAFTADSITFEKCKYVCTIEVDAYVPNGNTIARVFMQGLPSSGASVTNGALYFAEFSISSTDPLREPTVSWRKIGALAWKNSASGGYTPAGSLSGGAISVTPSTTSFYAATSSTGGGSRTNGTAASWSATVSDDTLTFAWTTNTPTAVTMPTFTSKTVATGIQSATISTQPTFTGTAATITVS